MWSADRVGGEWEAVEAQSPPSEILVCEFDDDLSKDDKDEVEFDDDNALASSKAASSLN
jgi:hypothetical protein